MELMIIAKLRRLNKAVAILVGVGLFACATFVVLDIIGRQLGASFGGTEEIAGYTMAIATSWGMSFTLLEMGHVRIDLLRNRAASFGRAMFDLFSMVVMSAVIVTIAVMSWPVLARSLENGSRANTPMETPLALVQVPWFAGWLWFACMSCAVTLCALSLIVKGRYGATESFVGAFAEQDTLQ